MSHFLLQLEYAKHERFGSGRATGNIDIHRNDPITASRDRVTVVIVSAAVGTAAHGDDPSRVRHLIVDLPQSRSHFVREGAGHNHDVRLPGRRAENDAQAILIVARCGQVHHFDGAARQAEGHRPEGALARPVGDGVESCADGGRR